MVFKLSTILLIITLFTMFSINAQTMQTQALKLFNEEKYAEAAKIYASIIESNSRDVSANYYYGVCLYHLNQTSEAIQRLKFSSTRAVSPDLYYYLGKLYQKVYEMELAIQQFEQFLKLNKNESPKIADAQKAIADCNSSIKLINKYFDIKVIKKDTVDKKSLLNYINLSKDAGELMLSQKFFVSGVDNDQIIFRTERGNEVLFPVKEADNRWNLYKIVRLLDSWNDPEKLDKPVNSAYDELYPFLLIDGVTLYFSSNRPGGMGGLDIYQSFYDPETGTFSEPSNLGPPFNSQYDDFMLVPDLYEGKAWFVTNRNIENDQYVVVEIIWDDSVIKNNTENINQLLHIAALPINEDVFFHNKKPSELKDNRQQNQKNVFYFMINDTLIYKNKEQFRSSEALEAFNTGFEIEKIKNNLLVQLEKKRINFAQSYDKNEQNKLYNDIVSIEQQTYGLDVEINKKYLNARQLEIEKIKHLKNEGLYYIRTTSNPQFITVDEIDHESEIDDETEIMDEFEIDDETGYISQNEINPEKLVSSAFQKPKKLEYKIQVGAYKNKPDQKLFEKIPAITKSITDVNGITKYYSGSWEKLEIAQSMVKSIRESGFEGAFVVAFLDGEQISLEKAKEIENK